jgi:hypothetical protein
VLGTGALLDAFFIWTEATVTKLLAKSALAEPLRYTTKRRNAVTRCVTDGRLEGHAYPGDNAECGIVGIGGP